MISFFWIAFLGTTTYGAVLPPAATFHDASRTTMSSEHSLMLLERDNQPMVNPKNKAIKLPKATGAWLTIPCDKYSTTDQNAANMTKRYLDAGVPEAWDELMSAWTAYLKHPTDGTSKNLRFPYWMANIYNGLEGNDCDYVSSACQSARCAANGLAPATYIIQNNFNFLWHLFHDISTAYSNAKDSIDVKMKDFTATFAPLIDDKAMIQHVLELFLFTSLVFIPTGFASMASKEAIRIATKEAAAKAAEEAAKSAAKAAKKAAKAAEEAAKSAAKADKKKAAEAAKQAAEKKAEEATDKATKAAAEAAKEKTTPYGLAANALVGTAVYVHNTVGNYLKTAETLADEKDAFKDYIGSYLLDISHRLNETQSPLVELRDEKAREQMRALVTDGSLNVLEIQRKQTSPDISGSLQASAEKVLWGMLLQPAWRSVKVPRNPFLLRVEKKDYKCNDPLSTSKIDLDMYMSDDTRKKTIWCDPEGNSFFLLDTRKYPSCSLPRGQKCKSQLNFKRFVPLPGGEADTLKKITGITLEDIVRAQYGAYLHNGKHNGYISSSTSNEVVGDDFKVKQGDVDVPLSGGIRIPGFFNISICTGDPQDIATSIEKGDYDINGAPCDNIKTGKSILQIASDTVSEALKSLSPGLRAGKHISTDGNGKS